jgi:hypothetical protein
MERLIMAFLLPFTTRQVCKAMADSMVKYDNAPDKDDFCNPDVALVVKLKNKKYGVLSYGGDPDEEGLVLELVELK